MKKLLLLVSFSGCFIFASCQNSGSKTKTSATKTENPNIIKPPITTTPVTTDTTKGKGQTSSSGTVGTGTSTPKDTTHHHVKGKAVVHNAPNQTKIDSIKQVKGKNKK